MPGGDLMSVTYLDRILYSHRRVAAADSRPLEPLLRDALSRPPARGFAKRLAAGASVPGRVAVIAEIKRRTPSKGDLRAGLDPDVIDPARLARQYEAGGASCLSVLTDEAWFAGSAADLREARAAVSLPTLRKDFTVDARDVLDARIMGADCVLLIVAALTAEELARFAALAREVGIDALVEVHDERELERALTAGAEMIGVNQRDLVTFEVDQARAVRLAPLIPSGVVRVAESGIRGPADVRALADAGFHAVLVGEALVRSSDPSAAVRALRSAGAARQ